MLDGIRGERRVSCLSLTLAVTMELEMTEGRRARSRQSGYEMAGDMRLLPPRGDRSELDFFESTIKDFVFGSGVGLQQSASTVSRIP